MIRLSLSWQQGLEEYREIGFVVTRDGMLTFLDLVDGKTIKQYPLTELEGSTITSSFVSQNNKLYSFGTNDGFILPVTDQLQGRFRWRQKGYHARYCSA